MGVGVDSEISERRMPFYIIDTMLVNSCLEPPGTKIRGETDDDVCVPCFGHGVSVSGGITEGGVAGLPRIPFVSYTHIIHTRVDVITEGYHTSPQICFMRIGGIGWSESVVLAQSWGLPHCTFVPSGWIIRTAHESAIFCDF